MLNPDLPVTARLNTSQTKFAMTAGGGLDIKVSQHMSFRPIGVDYYLTKLGNLPVGGLTATRIICVIQPASRSCSEARSPRRSGTGTGAAHQDLPGRPRGEFRCDLPEAGYHAGRQRHVAGSVPGRHDPGSCDAAKRSERTGLRMVGERTAGKPGSEFHFWHGDRQPACTKLR